MLFRASNCGAVGLDAGYNVGWIRASSPDAAMARLRSALAATFGVDSDRVTFENLTGETELFRMSIQPRDAGDRRLLEVGRRGHSPTYLKEEGLLLFLSEEDRARIRNAAAAAAAHEREIWALKAPNGIEAVGEVLTAARRIGVHRAIDAMMREWIVSIGDPMLMVELLDERLRNVTPLHRASLKSRE